MSGALAPIPGRAYAVVAMLFLFQTLNFFDKLVLGLSAVPIMKELHLSPKEFGAMAGSFFFLFSITGVLVGLFLTGRIRAKWLLVVLALIWSASQFPIYFTSSIAVLFACRILLGAGEGPGLPSALHACYNWFPPERRSIPSALVLQGISAGFIIGGPLLGYIVRTYGWREAFLFCGALSLVWTIAWILISAEGPYAAPLRAETPATKARDDNAPRVPASALWLDRTVIGVTLMSFMSYYVVGMAAVWLPPYIQQGLGYAPATRDWIIFAVFALQSPLLLGGAWICQRMQRRGVSGRISLSHASTLALLIPGIALVAAVQTTGTLQLVLIAIAFAFPSLTTIFGPVILSNIAPPAQRGLLIVVIYSGNALAGLVSNYGSGWIIDAAGPQALATGYANAMLTAGGVLLLGALSSLVLVFPDETAARFARLAGIAPRPSAPIMTKAI